MKAHCTTCRKPRESMRTDSTRCGVCGATLAPPAAAARPAVEPDLFSGPAPYVAHSATSKAAAETVRGLNEKRATVLRWFVTQGEGSDNELIDALRPLGWSYNTPRARRVELHQAGHIAPSGGQRNGSALWEATDKGRAALAAWDARKAAA